MLILTIILFPRVFERMSVHVLKNSSGIFEAGTFVSRLKRGIFEINVFLLLRLIAPETVKMRINLVCTAYTIPEHKLLICMCYIANIFYVFIN